MLLKTSFSLPHLFCNVEFEFSWLYKTKQSPEILIRKTEMLLEFQNTTNIETIGFSLIHFGFALDSSDINLWQLDLLDTDIPSKHFFCLQNVLKTSLRHVKIRATVITNRASYGKLDVFKTCLEDAFSVTIFRLQRRLQDVFIS